MGFPSKNEARPLASSLMELDSWTEDTFIKSFQKTNNAVTGSIEVIGLSTITNTVILSKIDISQQNDFAFIGNTTKKSDTLKQVDYQEVEQDSSGSSGHYLLEAECQVGLRHSEEQLCELGHLAFKTVFPQFSDSVKEDLMSKGTEAEGTVFPFCLMWFPVIDRGKVITLNN